MASKSYRRLIDFVRRLRERQVDMATPDTDYTHSPDQRKCFAAMREMTKQHADELEVILTEFDDGWISFNEESPHEGQQIDVWDTAFGRCCDRLFKGGRVYHYLDVDKGEEKWGTKPGLLMTHWRPIPSPPRG